MVNHITFYSCIINLGALWIVLAVSPALANQAHLPAGQSELCLTATNGDMSAEHGSGVLLGNDKSQIHISQEVGPTLELLRKAAEEGKPEAALNLSRAYLYSLEGVDQDSVQGLKWLRKAAQCGSSQAQYLLGTFYSQGKYVSMNPTIAKEWWEKAAVQGAPKAERALGILYLSGNSVPKNYKQAVDWFRKAAESDPKAQFYLGEMYWNAQGVSFDINSAIGWWQKAALNGNTNAQIRLANAYANGIGLSTNLMKADMWYHIARWSDDGDPVRKRRCRRAYITIEQDMTPSEISAAQRLASRWKTDFIAAHMITDDEPSKLPK